jgi:glyoxylase I family protein
VADHDAYQEHPLHRAFLEQNRSRWAHVRVFDAHLLDERTASLPVSFSAAQGGIEGFHHVALRSRDFDRSTNFYTGTLGLAVKMAWGAAPARAVMLDAGNGNILEIFERPNSSPPPADEGAILHVALRVASVDAVARTVRAAGMPVTMEPTSVRIATTNGLGPVPVRIAFFKGPDGEVVELFQAT